MVLVDSSVWIDFFRNGEEPGLVRLLEEDMVCTNGIILTELLPALSILKNKKEVIEGLKSLNTIPLEIDWSIVRKYQHINLLNGINKVGIPDLLILQQVINNKITLYSKDKHFMLMSEYFEFQLF